MDDAKRVRFWLTATAVIILNIIVWIYFETQSGAPTTIRIVHATNASPFEYSGRLEIRFDRGSLVLNLTPNNNKS